MLIEVDWDKYAKQYDNITLSGANPAYLDLIRKTGEYYDKRLNPGDIFADIGGGTGNFSIELARKNPEVNFVLIDNSIGMLERALVKSRGLQNFEVMEGDITEDIPLIEKKYGRKIDHAILMHALYTTGNVSDKEPRKVLQDISDCMKPSLNSTLFISDINRPLNTRSWIPYCLQNAYRTFRNEGKGPIESLSASFRFFNDNDQSRKANKYIDEMQKNGKYLICDIETLVGIVENAGFKVTYFSNEPYRGRDNLIIANRL